MVAKGTYKGENKTFPIRYNQKERLKVYSEGIKDINKLAEQFKSEDKTNNTPAQYNKCSINKKDCESIAVIYVLKEVKELQKIMDQYLFREGFAKHYGFPDELTIVCDENNSRPDNNFFVGVFENSYIHNRLNMSSDYIFNQLKVPLSEDEQTKDSTHLKSITVKDLFYQLRLDEEKLKEVYEFVKKDNSSDYTGKFTKNGEQKLAEILGKDIFYIDQSLNNHVEKCEQSK